MCFVPTWKHEPKKKTKVVFIYKLTMGRRDNKTTLLSKTHPQKKCKNILYKFKVNVFCQCFVDYHHFTLFFFFKLDCFWCVFVNVLHLLQFETIAVVVQWMGMGMTTTTQDKTQSMWCQWYNDTRHHTFCLWYVKCKCKCNAIV